MKKQITLRRVDLCLLRCIQCCRSLYALIDTCEQLCSGYDQGVDVVPLIDAMESCDAVLRFLAEEVDVVHSESDDDFWDSFVDEE